jgi:hypothetical protein
MAIQLKPVKLVENIPDDALKSSMGLVTPRRLAAIKKETENRELMVELYPGERIKKADEYDLYWKGSADRVMTIAGEYIKLKNK